MTKPVLNMAGTFALLGLLLAGCKGPNEDRPPTFPVSGRVLFDGKPAAGARIQLNAIDSDPKLARLYPHAEAGADGSFRMTTFQTGDGAPAGRYAMTLTWPLPAPPGREEGPDRFKGRHADLRRPLRQVQVVAGENIIDPIRIK